jgi:hypothetical protein
VAWVPFGSSVTVNETSRTARKNKNFLPSDRKLDRNLLCVIVNHKKTWALNAHSPHSHKKSKWHVVFKVYGNGSTAMVNGQVSQPKMTSARKTDWTTTITGWGISLGTAHYFELRPTLGEITFLGCQLPYRELDRKLPRVIGYTKYNHRLKRANATQDIHPNVAGGNYCKLSYMVSQQWQTLKRPLPERGGSSMTSARNMDWTRAISQWGISLEAAHYFDLRPTVGNGSTAMANGQVPQPKMTSTRKTDWTGAITGWGISLGTDHYSELRPTLGEITFLGCQLPYRKLDRNLPHVIVSYKNGMDFKRTFATFTQQLMWRAAFKVSSSREMVAQLW